METTTNTVARALAALGHETRLGLFRLLVQAGPEGLSVGQLGRHTGVAPSTLNHHLATLVDAGLVQQMRQGREVRSFANYEAMNRTVAFLSEACCQGVAAPLDEGSVLSAGPLPVAPLSGGSTP